MAGPAVGRLHSGRPGESKGQPKLVDVLSVRPRTRVRFPPPPLFGSNEPFDRSASGGTIACLPWDHATQRRLLSTHSAFSRSALSYGSPSQATATALATALQFSVHLLRSASH